MSLVDVVVPTRTRATSALAASTPPAHHVHSVVIDNASHDGTADAIESRWPDVTVVRSEANLGYGQACNTGARHGTGEFVLILNSDAIARPGAVERLAQYLAERPTTPRRLDRSCISAPTSPRSDSPCTGSQPLRTRSRSCSGSNATGRATRSPGGS